jgi:PAS domain S-box-containing protein
MRVEPRAPTTADSAEVSIERALLADLDRLRLVIEHLPVVTYTLDLEGPREEGSYVSGGIERLTGYTPDEWLADADLWDGMIHPDDHDAVAEAWQRLLDDGEPFDREFRVVRRDGAELWLREKAVATTRDGRALVDGIFEDVTERRLAQDRLAAAEQRTHDLVEQVPAVLYEELPGARGVTSFVSPQIRELLDVSPETYMEDPNWWVDHLHPDDRVRMVEEADAYLEHPGQRTFSSEYRLVTPTGRTVWINDRSTATLDASGRAVLVRGAMFDVTAQKLAEAQLTDAEARYRTLVEQLPLITYIWEVDAAPGEDTAYYTSPQIEGILGYTAADYNDDPEGWRDMIHPEDRDRVNEAAARSETTGEPFVEEYRYVHKTEGRSVWVHDESVLLRRTDDGRHWLFQGIMYDITARVEADLALQSSLARFQTLAKQAPVGIFEDEADGSCTFVNDRWCEVAGMDPASAMGFGWTDAIHPSDREEVFADWASARASDRAFLAEFRFQHADGEVRWVTARAAAVKDAQGVTTGFVGTIDDMTERRATEEQLRLIRSAVEHTGHAVMVAALPLDGSPAPVVYINPAFTTMTGLDATEVLGQAATTFYEPLGDTTGTRDRIREGSSETLEVEVIRKDGSRVAAEGVISPIRDAAGAFSNIVIILRDITDVREIERKLRGSIEELRRGEADRRASLAQIVEAQEQELDRMAGGIEDHSLQQMSAVRMRMETLRRTLSDPAELGALAKLEGSVEEAVGQLRGLVSELRPRELTTEGLGGAIREHLTRTTSLRTEVVGALAQDPEPSQAATAFRVVQEATASALEDRSAGVLRVELEDDDDGFCVRIVDDGASWTTVGSPTMQDRAGLAGGRCRLFDGNGGATVELWLPLRAPVAGEHPLRRS